MELHFNRQDFEAIYYKDFNGDYFRSPSIKAPFRNMLLGLVTLLVFLVYSYVQDNYNLFVMWFFVFGAMLWSYIAALNNILK